MNYQAFFTILLCLLGMLLWQRAYFGALRSVGSPGQPKKSEVQARSPALLAAPVADEQAASLGPLSRARAGLLYVMKALNRVLGNYGLSIIVLTLLLKLATSPLVYIGAKQARALGELGEEIKKIKAGHPGDPAAQNRAIQTWMKARGRSAWSAALPLLIQAPVLMVFMALYQAVSKSPELHGAPFAFWLRDLSAPDPLFLLPALYAFVLYAQQRWGAPQTSRPLTSTATAAATQTSALLRWMPLLIGASLVRMPSGAGLYLVTNALLTLGQQRLMRRLTTAATPVI